MQQGKTIQVDLWGSSVDCEHCNYITHKKARPAGQRGQKATVALHAKAQQARRQTPLAGAICQTSSKSHRTSKGWGFRRHDMCLNEMCFPAGEAVWSAQERFLSTGGHRQGTWAHLCCNFVGNVGIHPVPCGKAKRENITP